MIITRNLFLLHLRLHEGRQEETEQDDNGTSQEEGLAPAVGRAGASHPS
jgi:hypothetical protein